jgi:hypothetical protein
MNINLATDWLLLDNTTANTIYYGYNLNYNSGTNSNTWAIRQIIASSSVYWNNAAALTYEANWANRAAFFTTPTNITITATAKGGPSIYTVTFNWTTCTGSSRYYVTPFRGNSLLYNLLDGGASQQNPYQNSATEVIVNANSITIQNCPSGYTYSASIYAGNGFGTSSTVSASIAL